MIRLVRNLELFNEVETSRKSGMSYTQLHKKYGVSKGTLSSWFSNSKWSGEIKTQLSIRNNEQSRIHMKNINIIRSSNMLLRRSRYIQEARDFYEKNKSNMLFIAGVSIYWGEGEKVNKGRVSIINTDPTMLVTEINFFRKVLDISDSKLRAAMFLYNDLNKNSMLEYWSKTLKLPKSQFIKTQILPSRSHHTKRKVLYGICNIYFSSVEYNIKIKEWINLLSINLRL
jgi:uncharacterized protein YjcR